MKMKVRCLPIDDISSINDHNVGKNKSLDNIVTYTTIAATILVTYAAVFFLGNEIDKIKNDLILQRRMSRLVSFASNI